MKKKTTFCRFCEAHCGLTAEVEHGRITRIQPDTHHVLSKGHACIKGRFAHQLAHDPDRILYPMRREGDGWHRVSWEQALREIAGRLNRIRAQHGPDAVGLYFGNPSAHSYSHRLYGHGFRKALGTRNCYGAATQDNAASFVVSNLMYGSTFLRPVPDLRNTRYLLLFGVNPAVSRGTMVNIHNVREYLRQIRRRGGKIVVVDPRRSETARMADEHHFIRPDTDVLVLMAMIRTIFAENLHDSEFLSDHANNIEDLRYAVQPFTPAKVADRTGISAAVIRRLATEFATTDGACCYGRLTCGRFGTLTSWALDALNVVTGKLGRPGGPVFANGVPDTVRFTEWAGETGYSKHASRVGGHPEVLSELPSGILADEITTPGEGQIRGLVVSAGNPVLSIANGPSLTRALRELECMVAIDIYLNETAALGHYFLPATTFLEREDFTLLHANLMVEPYAQWTEPVIPPQGEARQEWEIFTDLSEAMGLPLLGVPGLRHINTALEMTGVNLRPELLLDAAIRLGPRGDRFVPWSNGITLDRIKQHPHGMLLDNTNPFELSSRLRTADRKIRLWHPDLTGEIRRLNKPAVDQPDPRFPFLLIGRRDRRSNNTWVHNLAGLMKGSRCRALRLHPADARREGISDGQTVTVRSDVGFVQAVAKVTDEVMEGVVSLPHGWTDDPAPGRSLVSINPGPNCNELMNQRVIDPLSGMAFLNGVPVAVEKTDDTYTGSP